MSIRLSEDNHDSWVTCTTSAECKTVITTVLTVMSGMDRHMINENIGMGNGHVLVGLCQSGFY
jgi:ABC-type lipoprotein release transport system permease subunit